MRAEWCSELDSQPDHRKVFTLGPAGGMLYGSHLLETCNKVCNSVIDCEILWAILVGNAT